MSCPSGEVITVTYAQYGRWSGLTCQTVEGEFYSGTCDRYVDIINDASTACDGKQTCSYKGSNGVQGVVKQQRQDPCGGVHKYTRVKYTCVYQEPTTSSETGKTRLSLTYKLSLP